jgi:hypothetical protein
MGFYFFALTNYIRGTLPVDKIREEELASPVIDLTNGDKLDESFLRMFGFWTKKILNYMFGGSAIPVTLKGNKKDVAAFTKAVGKEKKYMDSIRRYGLDNPKTFKNKSKLERAVSDFTRKTGLKWPFK